MDWEIHGPRVKGSDPWVESLRPNTCCEHVQLSTLLYIQEKTKYLI